MGRKKRREEMAALIIHGISHDYKRVLASLLREANQIGDSEPGALGRAYEDSADSISTKLVSLESELDKIANSARKREIELETLIAKIRTDVVQLIRGTLDIVPTPGGRVPKKIWRRSNIRAFRSRLVRARTQIEELVEIAESIIGGEDIHDLDPQFGQEISIQKEIEDRILDDISTFIEANSIDRDDFLSFKGDYKGKIDRTMFAIAVSNIIKNSIVHSGKAKDTRIKVQISHKTNSKSETSEEMLIVRFLDNGIGLPRTKGKREALFKLFQQGTGGDDGAPGTGIGLAFARFAAKQSGGAIEAEWHKDGAMFVLSIPAQGGAN